MSAITKNETIEAIRKLLVTCADDDWDGEFSSGIFTESAERAIALVRSLPGDIESPFAYCDPDGCVELEWAPTFNHRVVVSVDCDPHHTLLVAFVFPTRSGNAVLHYDKSDPAFPESIIKMIREVYPAPTTRGEGT